ncbi:hypothetical protein [Agarilytica rhodophyticola]|uniref:hypothetical protein n=1 Tax=Agarilytica rhodophyticola TaxID=1737490 RepID=UPI000B345970|nr:hypothetical protein [Agarilytica rhodophyticola]
MGIDFYKLSNHDKKEYITPLESYMLSNHVMLLSSDWFLGASLSFLVCEPHEIYENKGSYSHALLGSWSGNKLKWVSGKDADIEPIYLEDGWIDLTAEVFLMLLEIEHANAHALLNAIGSDSVALKAIKSLYKKSGSEVFESKFEECFGRRWKKKIY